MKNLLLSILKVFISLVFKTVNKTVSTVKNAVKNIRKMSSDGVDSLIGVSVIGIVLIALFADVFGSYAAGIIRIVCFLSMLIIPLTIIIIANTGAESRLSESEREFRRWRENFYKNSDRELSDWRKECYGKVAVNRQSKVKRSAAIR
jgi:uncharacterized membrane protein